MGSFGTALLMQPDIGQQTMGNRFGGGIFLGFGIEVTEGEAEFLLDVGEDWRKACCQSVEG